MLDSFELSKIGGAICLALLLIVVPKTIIGMRTADKGPVKNGFQLSGPAGEAAPAAAAPAEAAAPAPDAPAPSAEAAPAAGGFDAKAVVAKIASANADNGKAGFTKCAGCHSAEIGAPNKVGPNLWGVVGRAKAGAEGFAGYSAGLKGKGGNWTLEDLASFIHGPAAYVAGTKMIFPGVKDDAALADLLAYMRNLSDSPVPLP